MGIVVNSLLKVGIALLGVAAVLAFVKWKDGGHPAFFMVKKAQEVNSHLAAERFEFKTGESAVFLVGGVGYAGKPMRVEFWAKGRKAAETSGVVPSKGASAAPFISHEPLAVTAKLFIDGKFEREVMIRFTSHQALSLK